MATLNWYACVGGGLGGVPSLRGKLLEAHTGMHTISAISESLKGCRAPQKPKSAVFTLSGHRAVSVQNLDVFCTAVSVSQASRGSAAGLRVGSPSISPWSATVWTAHGQPCGVGRAHVGQGCGCPRAAHTNPPTGPHSTGDGSREHASGPTTATH